MNDGSTAPAALAVLDAYRGADPRIRVVDHERNRGLGAARNTGQHLDRSAVLDERVALVGRLLDRLLQALERRHAAHALQREHRGLAAVALLVLGVDRGHQAVDRDEVGLLAAAAVHDDRLIADQHAAGERGAQHAAIEQAGDAVRLAQRTIAVAPLALEDHDRVTDPRQVLG